MYECPCSADTAPTADVKTRRDTPMVLPHQLAIVGDLARQLKAGQVPSLTRLGFTDETVDATFKAMFDSSGSIIAWWFTWLTREVNSGPGQFLLASIQPNSATGKWHGLLTELSSDSRAYRIKILPHSPYVIVRSQWPPVR